MSLATATWAALLEPKRAGPIVLVAGALLATEALYSDTPISPLVLAGFVTAFVLFGPLGWRLVRRRPSAIRVAGYALLCAGIVLPTTLLAPGLLNYAPYVADPPATPAIYALVAIAGWVLGRDIDTAATLATSEATRVALAREAEDARLLSLRQHFDPHFLFNTLGAIAEWCREDPEVAERALLELSSMLRTLFEGVRDPWWPLKRELAVAESLYRLYAFRDDERYAFELLVEAVPDVDVPPLVLLPLVENSLTHGDAPRTFSLAQDAESVRIELWNAGAYKGRREGGTGLETATRRLALAYGDAASVEIASKPREVEGTLTTIVLPKEGKR